MENYQKSALFIANYSLAICCCSLNDYSNYSSSFFCNQINAFEIWYWKVSRWKKSKNKIFKYFNAAQILLYPTNLRLTKCEIFSSISSINTRSMCSCSAKTGACKRIIFVFNAAKNRKGITLTLLNVPNRNSCVSSPLCCCQLVCALWEW